jgi:hypothetical protein
VPEGIGKRTNAQPMKPGAARSCAVRFPVPSPKEPSSMNTNQWVRQNNSPDYIDYERELRSFADKGNSSVDMRVSFDIEARTAYVTVSVHNDSGNTLDMIDMTNTSEINITWAEGERLIGMTVSHNPEKE